ncbi:hypothetical protein BDN71DRAFT_1432920 [Pleurotus eryngii]|uniref:Uncharacterized protein n=1 Tax=Pleurotus eryngii TaxID=5323 RepID=A0A9P6DE71_PLEER|nr:hypothetical protein BDN71DRAFT_1432920 [Pleurotus eryngii]
MGETDTTTESKATSYSYASYSYAASFTTALSSCGNPAPPTHESNTSTSHHGHALTSPRHTSVDPKGPAHISGVGPACRLRGKPVNCNTPAPAFVDSQTRPRPFSPRKSTKENFLDDTW